MRLTEYHRVVERGGPVVNRVDATARHDTNGWLLFPFSGGFQILFIPCKHLLPTIYRSVHPVARPVNGKKTMTGVLVRVELVYLVKAFELYLHARDVLR